MWVNNPAPSAQITVILLIPILLFYLASLTPKAVVSQNTITSVKKFAPSGTDWNTLCTDLSQMKVLLPKCI